MYLKGATLEGAKYGGITPLDFDGLKLWMKSSVGVTFSRGNAVASWQDISPNHINFTPVGATGIPQTSAGLLVQSSYGLGYTSPGTGSNLLRADNIPHFNFLLDGSPHTMMVVFQAATTFQASFFGSIPLNPPTGSVATLGIGTSVTSRHIQAVSGTSVNLYTLDVATANTPVISGSSYVYEEVNYGFGSGQNPIVFNAFNQVAATSRAAYTNPPTAGAGYTNPFCISQPGGKNIYEIIMYDHTGKTKAQIDLERQRLVDEYVKQNYPNIY